MKLSRENIKDIIYAATLIIGGLLWWRDELHDKAEKETVIVVMQNDLEEVKTTQKEKFKEYDQRWEESIKADEHITTLLDYLVDESE